MKLRVSPRFNDNDYIPMSHMAFKAWKEKLVKDMEWAQNDPRAIIMSIETPQNEAEIRRRFQANYNVAVEE